MNRLTKCAFVGLALVPVMASAQNSQTIYKFVDESGRVTYANTPIKGGAKVNLEPLTVLQSSSGASNSSPTTARAIPVAKVISVPSPTSAANAVPVAFAAAIAAPVETPAIVQTKPTLIAALDTGDKVQQRRADVRRRILQSEIQAEGKSLEASRNALAEEQRRSGEVWTMRASFAATTNAVTAQKPLISPEVRAEIERHFERVRNLQDEVTMHEGSIAALREELVATR
ncbi:MAG: DUF4124 domain-containing protein [Burkholderiales bacterium]|nr:DUF4124 domain-containing protein [Burkholderiales bacterium]